LSSFGQLSLLRLEVGYAFARISSCILFDGTVLKTVHIVSTELVFPFDRHCMMISQWWEIGHWMKNIMGKFHIY